MPLSRQEQRALVDIERGLLSDDPRFVARVECWPSRSRRRPLACVVLGLVTGVVLLTVGLIGDDPLHIALAVAGFTAIVASCSVAMATRARRMKRAVRWRPPR